MNISLALLTIFISITIQIATQKPGNEIITSGIYVIVISLIAYKKQITPIYLPYLLISNPWSLTNKQYVTEFTDIYYIFWAISLFIIVYTKITKRYIIILGALSLIIYTQPAVHPLVAAISPIILMYLLPQKQTPLINHLLTIIYIITATQTTQILINHLI